MPLLIPIVMQVQTIMIRLTKKYELNSPKSIKE